MSKTVDNRAVKMEFDNSQFEKNLQTSINSLDRFKESLKLEDAAKGFNELDKVSNIDFSKMESSLEALEHRFSTLGIIGMTVVQDLTNSVIAGAKKLTGFITSNVMEGGWARAANIEQAKFQLEGLGIAWENVADDISYAVDGTAYGLDAAANAAAQLSASGVQAGEDMKAALRGISGVAAMTNTTYEEISPIFTTVAGQGKLMTMQLRQLESRGVNAAATLGKELGYTEAQIRDMVTKGQIDFNTFATAMNSAFGEHAKDANKTFDGALANMRAALKKIGAEVAGPLRNELRDVFNSIREDINVVKKQLTDTHTFEIINDIIHDISVDLQAIFKDPNFGKATLSIITTIQHLFADLLLVLNPIKKAFRDIFPKQTTDGIVEFLEKVEDMASKLYPSAEASENLRRTFRGLFSILDILGQAFSAVIRTLFPATQGFGGVAESILGVTGSMGDWVTALAEFLKENDIFYKALQKIKDIVSLVVPYIETAFETISGIFKSLGDASTVDTVNEKFAKFGKLAPLIQGASEAFAFLKEQLKKTSPLLEEVGNLAQSAFDKITGAVKNIFNGKFDQLPKLIASVLVTGVGVGMAKFFNKINRTIKNGLGITSRIGNILYEVQGAIHAFSTSIKVDTLMTLAKAIGLITLSLIGLSLIDGKSLARSLAAVSVVIFELVGAVAAINLIMAKMTVKKTNPIEQMLSPFTDLVNTIKKSASITGMLMGIGSAVALLAGSIYALGQLKPEQLEQGLKAMSIVLVELVGALLILGKAGGEVRASLGTLLGLGIAVNLVTRALKTLGSMKIDELKRGISGLGAALAELAIFLLAMDKWTDYDLGGTAKSMLVMSIGLNALALAFKQFAGLKLEEIGKGALGMGAALTEMGVFFGLMERFGGDKMLSAAAAMTVLSGAMLIVAKGMQAMGSLKVEQLGVAIAGFAVSMGLMTGVLMGLAAFANVFETSGAAKMIAAAGAMTILAIAFDLITPAIVALGNAGLENVAVGVGAMAVAVFAMAGAGMLATNAVPGLLALSAAMVALGISVVGIGAGIALLATGIATLVAVGPLAAAGIATLGEAIRVVIVALAAGAAEGVLAFVNAIADGLPSIIDAVRRIGTAILDLLQEWIPKVAELVKTLVIEVAHIFGDCIPEIVDAALDLIVGLMTAIREHIQDITSLALEIVTGFINGLAQGIPDIVDAGMNLVVQLIDGMATAIENNGDALKEAMAHLITSVLAFLAGNLPDFFQFGVNLVSSILEGLIDVATTVIDFFVDLVADILVALGVDEQFVEVGKNFIKGIIKGLGDALHWVVEKATEVATSILDTVKGILKINSPSVVMYEIGEWVDEGLAGGMEDNIYIVEQAGDEIGNTIKDKVVAAADTAISAWDRVTAAIHDRSPELQSKLNKLAEKYAGISEANTELAETTEQVAEEMENESTATGKSGKASSSATKEKEKLAEAQEKLTKTTHVLIHEYGDLYEALDIKDPIEKTQEALEKLGLTVEEFGDIYDKIGDQVESAFDKIFDTPAERSYIAKEAILYNMRENINQVSQWADSLGRLSEKGIHEGIYNKLREMGPEGYKYVHAFMEMTDDELSRANQMYQEALDIKPAVQNRVAAGLLNTGLMSAEGLVKGIESKHEELYEAGAKGAEKVEEGADDELDINSPSEKMRWRGQMVDMGLINGIYEGVDNIVFAIQVVCDRILTEFDVKLVNNSRIPEIGKQLMAKLATGMMLSVATFDAIVEEMISTVVKAINKKAKEINQNGTYICEWMVKGFSEAMPKQERTINDTMKKMMDLLVKGFQTDENKSVISKDFVEWFVQNFCDAILDENTSLETFTTTYEELVAWMDETLREYQETFYNIGAFWMEGLAQGITENGQMAIAAAQAVANQIVSITESAKGLWIGSPSKKAIQIGKWWDMGLAKGIMNYRKLPVVSAKKLAKQIVKLTSNTIPELSKKIEAKVKPSVKKIAEAIASETDTIQIFKKTDKIAKAFVPISKYAKSTAKATSGSVKEIWVNVEKAGTKVSKTVNNAIKFVKNLKTNIEKFDSADKLTKAFSGLDKYFIDYDKVPGKVIKFLQNVSSEMDPIGDSVKYLAEEFYGADKYTAGFNESTVKAMGALSNFMGIIFDSTEAGKEYTKNLEDAAEAEQKYAEKRDEINQKLAEGEEVSESEYEKLQELEKEWQEAQAKVGTWLQAGTKAYKEYRDGIVETLKTQTSFFEALEKGTVTSPATMIFNKKSWIQGDKDFNSMITDLAKRGLEPDILKDALEEGVTSANLAMLQSFSNASDADIAMINQLIEKQKNVATKSGKQATAAVVEAFSDDAAEQRKTMSDQIDQGLVMWYNSFEGGFGKIKKIIKNFSEDTQEFKTFAGKMSEAISSIAPAFDLLGEKYLGISNASQLLDTDSMKAAKQVLKLGEAFGMVAEDSETYEHYVQRIADGIHEWGESLKEVYAISNPFEKFEKDSEISGSELLDNMQSQLNGVRDWASGLEELSKRGLSSALVKYLAELGPEAANYVDAFLSMTQSQIGEANEMYGQVLTIKDETAEQAKASWMYTGTKMGQAAQKGAKDAFEKEGSIRFPYGEEEAEEDGKDIGKAVSTGVVEETEDTGETVMYMICDGIEGHEPEIITTVRKSGKAISDTYVETVENEETGTKIANAVASSMNNGITESVESNVPKIVSSVQEQMTALADKIESALNKAFTNASETAIDKMNKAINKINKLIDEIPETISIKINVDTSDAQSAVNELNSAVRRLESNVASVNASVRSTATMYNNLSNGNGYSSYGSTYGTNGATTANNGKNGNSANNGGITINYNQTNNSPKALSVVEVYKNTQNQLVAVKSAISSMTGVKTY